MNLSKRESVATRTRFSGLVMVMITILTLAGSLWAQSERNQTRDQKTSENPLVGIWESDEATVVIRSDGTILINNEKYKYKIKDNTIIVFNDEGSLDFPFQLKGNQMTVLFEGRRIVYTRNTDKADDKSIAEKNSQQSDSNGSNPSELVGKWCYMSNLTGTNSRMSNRCFTLYEDGTYEYYAETSSSGSVASSASQESDSGRWSVSGNTIIAYSNANGKLTFPFEKRNHPKTGDPMIVLDGDAYVTAYQKNPW
jgi:hypothetical protein